MAYCSRLYFVDANRSLSRKKVIPVIIAEFNCERMPAGFEKIFQKEIDYKLYGVSGGVTPDGYECTKDTDTDCYGEHCKSASAKDIISWIDENRNDDYKYYRRIIPLYGMLTGFCSDEWRNLEVVHYGY